VDPVVTFKYPSRNVCYTVTYAKILSSLLPPPYSSNCTDYPDLGFESREERVERCVTDLAFGRYGKVPFNMVFLPDETGDPDRGKNFGMFTLVQFKKIFTTQKD